MGAYKERRPRHPTRSDCWNGSGNPLACRRFRPGTLTRLGRLAAAGRRRRLSAPPTGCDLRPSRQPRGASRSTFEGAVWSGRPWEASSARQGRSYRRVLPSGQGRVRPADPRPRADPRVGEPGRDARRRRAGSGPWTSRTEPAPRSSPTRRLSAAIPGRSPTSRKVTSSSTGRGPRSTARLARMPPARGSLASPTSPSTRSRGPRTRSSRSRQGRARALSGPCPRVTVRSADRGPQRTEASAVCSTRSLAHQMNSATCCGPVNSSPASSSSRSFDQTASRPICIEVRSTLGRCSP